MLTNSSRRMSRKQAPIGIVLMLLVLMAGCGSLKLPASFDGFSPVGKSEVESEKPEKTRGTYEVMMKPRYGKGSKATLPIKDTVLLQNVLESSGAVKKYKAMDITIYRPVKGSPVPLQMQCEYDAGNDSVSDAENYEIYPGDQVLLEEVANSKVGKLIGDLSPLDR